jgi:hypothetical protein
MPLVSETNSKGVAHGELRAVGFWMIVKGANPIQPVRVFISYEALADLDPTDVWDLATAFDHFDRFRARIEAAASDKFDRLGSDAEKYEGMSTVRLITSDPTSESMTQISTIHIPVGRARDRSRSENPERRSVEPS